MTAWPTNVRRLGRFKALRCTVYVMCLVFTPADDSKTMGMFVQSLYVIYNNKAYSKISLLYKNENSCFRQWL